MSTPEINSAGEVALDGHVIGTLAGFRFVLKKAEGEADGRDVRNAAGAVIAPEIAKRAEQVAGAPNGEFALSNDGHVRWRGEVIGELAEGNDVLSPRVVILADETLSGPDLEKVQDRLTLWLRHTINTQLEPLVALKSPADLEGAARGIAFQLAEGLGILPRPAVAEEVRGLDQDVRGKMRKMGVKFGAYHIYVPATLKPAPRELSLVLHALKNGGVRQPGVSELPAIALAGRTTIAVDPAFDPQLYAVAGYKVAGPRAVRVDILERLADIIRPLIAFDPARAAADVNPPEGAAEGNRFRVTVEMTSLLGCAGEDFAAVLRALGYQSKKTPLPAEESASESAEAAAPAAESVTPAPSVEIPADASGPGEAAPAVAAEAPEGVAPQSSPGETAPASDTSATDASAENAEPKFDEVWFPAPRHRGKGPARRANGAADTGDRRRQEGPRAKGRPPKSKRPPRGDKADQGSNARPRPSRPPREKPIDPDSPFAALAALRDKVTPGK